jgi:Ion channel
MTNPAAQLKLFRSGQGSGPRYGSLLLILVVTYLLSAFTSGRLVDTVQVVLFLAVVLIALRNGRFHRKTVRILAVGLLFGSGVCVILRLADDNGPGGALASLWTALILLLTAFLIVRQVVYQPRITGQSIYGVLSAYMIIGLIFSAVYVAMWKFGGPFFVPGEQANTQTFQYFSFTTLTTLGYGDFTAAGDGGRAVAVLEAIIGQMFLATLVARLVAGFRWEDRAAARRAAQQAVPAAVQGSHVTGTVPGSGPGDPHAGAPLPPTEPRAAASGRDDPDSGAPLPPAGSRAAGSGRPRAKKASAPGLIRLSPPGAVRGRGTGQRPGSRKGTGGSGPVPSPRPTERD